MADTKPNNGGNGNGNGNGGGGGAGQATPSPPVRALGPPPPKAPTSSSSSSLDPVVLNVIKGVCIGGVMLLIIGIIICCACRKNRKKNKKIREMQYHMDQAAKNNQMGNFPQHSGGNNNPGGYRPTPTPTPPRDQNNDYSGPHGVILPPPPIPMPKLSGNQSNFTYEDLLAATDGFSDANLLGQGGFGYVHKGALRDGTLIAVKRLRSGSGQGEREFQAEVEMINRVHHRHLVSLVGYCIGGGERILVYEYVPNDNLEFHLHGKGRPTMQWSIRLKIALGTAKGLAYLHEDCHPRIIHRDIKSSNILIDDSFEAKVGDFGLAKLNKGNQTHVSTRVMGTFGYLAPEYAASGKLTEKSDVYSYGVMLLELITGREPMDNSMEDSLVDWARPLCTRATENGNYNELADPFLESNYPPIEMGRMIACAAACIRHSAKRRPKMSKIAGALVGDISIEELNDSTRPGNAPSPAGGSSVASSARSSPSR